MLVVLLLLVAGNLSAEHGQSSMERQEFMQLFYRFSNPWQPRAQAGFPSIPGTIQLKMDTCLDRRLARW
jgi:hypothetical protein